MKNKKLIKNPVLIVEDSVANQLYLQELCSGMGISSVVADNGAVALELLDKQNFSLYIVDILMPVMDGKEFIQELKKIEPDAVIFIQTSLDSSETIIDIMKMGVFDYIIKPIDPVQFQKSLSKGIEFKRLKEWEKSEIVRFRSEISKIREIQVSLLPEFKEIQNFDIAFSILPVEDLSGDFLDGFFINDDIYQIILCDVSGHGMVSSYIGTRIRSMFRTISSDQISLTTLMMRVNENLTDDLTWGNYFGTVIVCQINIKTGIIKYVSGGHPPALFSSNKEKKHKEIKTKGGPIGLFKDWNYEEISFKIEKSDSLLLYTDGIIDITSEDGDTIFGEKRFSNCFIENTDNNSIDLINSILDSAYRFSNYSGQHDDITVICIKKR